jgi:SAM-dependent methyltransferase
LADPDGDAVIKNEFDAVFSNAALHWVRDDPDAPIPVAYRALRAGGRFVGELGGHGCVGAITVALLATLEPPSLCGYQTWTRHGPITGMIDRESPFLIP